MIAVLEDVHFAKVPVRWKKPSALLRHSPTFRQKAAAKRKRRRKIARASRRANR